MSMFGHTVRGLLEGVEAALSESVESLTIALNGVAASVGVLESEFASLEDSVHGVGGTVERIVDLEAGVGDTIERIVDLEAGVDSLEVSVNGPGGTVERISALESNGMTDSFSMDCTNVDSTIDNNLDISPHVSGHNFFHKCIEFKASAANYRSYYIGLLGDNTTNTNQFCIAGDGGGGGDPNAIAAFDDGGNVYMANDLFVDQKVECTSVLCDQVDCTTVSCDQVTLPDGVQTNAFTPTLKSAVDTNTVKTTQITYDTGVTRVLNTLFFDAKTSRISAAGSGLAIGKPNDLLGYDYLNGVECLFGEDFEFLPIFSRATSHTKGILFGNVAPAGGESMCGFISALGEWVMGDDYTKYSEGYRLYVDGAMKVNNEINVHGELIFTRATDGIRFEDGTTLTTAGLEFTPLYKSILDTNHKKCYRIKRVWGLVANSTLTSNKTLATTEFDSRGVSAAYLDDVTGVFKTVGGRNNVAGIGRMTISASARLIGNNNWIRQLELDVLWCNGVFNVLDTNSYGYLYDGNFFDLKNDSVTSQALTYQISADDEYSFYVNAKYSLSTRTDAQIEIIINIIHDMNWM